MLCSVQQSVAKLALRQIFHIYIFYFLYLQGEIAVLRNANHELTHKLAMQTQRLELVGVYSTPSVSKTPSDLPSSHTQKLSSDENVKHVAESLGISAGNVSKVGSIAPITRTENRGGTGKKQWLFW